MERFDVELGEEVVDLFGHEVCLEDEALGIADGVARAVLGGVDADDVVAADDLAEEAAALVGGVGMASGGVAALRVDVGGGEVGEGALRADGFRDEEEGACACGDECDAAKNTRLLRAWSHVRGIGGPSAGLSGDPGRAGGDEGLGRVEGWRGWSWILGTQLGELCHQGKAVPRRPPRMGGRGCAGGVGPIV